MSPTRVLVVEGLSGDGDVQAALSSGAASCVLKGNLSIQALVAKVQEALGTRRATVQEMTTTR